MLFGIVWSLLIKFYKKMLFGIVYGVYKILQLFITFSHIKFYKILQNQNVCKINFIKIFIKFYTILYNFKFFYKTTD